jgi:hypothetical protein
MIEFFSTVEALLYCLLLVGAILLSEAVVQYQKTQSMESHSRVKIGLLVAATAAMMGGVFASHCYPSTGVLECFYVTPGEELMRNIGIALFINTSLFLGGLHQWLYVPPAARRTARSSGSSCVSTSGSSSGTCSRSCSWYGWVDAGAAVRGDRLPRAGVPHRGPALPPHLLLHLLQRRPLLRLPLRQLLHPPRQVRRRLRLQDFR